MRFLNIINSDSITEEDILKLIPRSVNQLEDIKEAVITILNEVKMNRDKAIIDFSKKFDAVDLSIQEIQVLEEEIKKAYLYIDETLLEAFRYAKRNLTNFCEFQKRESWFKEIENGVKVGQIFRPIESLGIYIPGGRATYPSTVLMAAVPAHVAGVNKIILCTPPNKNKAISPEVLVAANEVGIKKIYKVGGAQAIAAMAYGTKTIPKVDKIIGPGNKWVNVAKQLLSSVVAIDLPAGPSEILIIADKNANHQIVIADLLSQIEHDPDNVGVIVTDSQELIENVKLNIKKFLKDLSRKEIIEDALENNVFLIKAKNLDDCIRISNTIAPEHLEILTENPEQILKKISNAGAIFIGKYSPVSLGDYSAGTNHILPTGGNAKNYSGLNIYHFLKTIDVLRCTKEGLKILSKSAIRIAEFEGFQAHKKSIEERLKEKN
ncbi:MAG: histidinol dehydrogenase [Promethearchaeota archaeon]|jgi:histidinol dehydrogenase